MSLLSTTQVKEQGTHEVIVAKTRLCKSDENFWIRTAILYNIFCREQQIYGANQKEKKG